MSATTILDDIRRGLVQSLDPKIVNELLEAYVEAKENFYAGGLRLSAVEGGRFCEAAFRLLQEAASVRITPLSRQLRTDEVIQELASLPTTQAPEAVRIHIPRSLRVVYDIRNKRDTAHLADGIDPNLQDAMLVATVIDWVLAEFVRLYHQVPPDEAQAIVESLVVRRAPAVEAFGAFLKVLNPALQASDVVLVLLYHCGKRGATLGDLASWVRPNMRPNLRRTLYRLEHERALVHELNGRYLLALTGFADVEHRGLYRLPS